MSRSWTDKDANGKALTDGRVCLVITNDSDPSMPAIRVYGKDKDEVLDKLAQTTETAQTTIHRLRTAAPAAAPRAAVSATPPAGLTAAEIATATADLSNPAKAAQAIVTLLGSAGVDVNAAQREQMVRRVQGIAANWHANHPDFPDDDRNKRILLDRAILRVGYRNITAQALDNAYSELLAEDMFFEAAQPGGSPAPRAVREATSYRRNSLRSPEPVATTDDSPKVREWRRIFESGNSRELRSAINTIPGFKEWANKQYTAQSA